ncbi:MAG TPA: response regulator [Bryobacteraceae bacterium]|jgi:CheY-like chemotaxis protein
MKTIAPADPGVLLILLVEDCQADVFLVKEAIRKEGLPAQLQVLNDGEKAVRFIDQIDAGGEATCPNLLLLDLNLPRISGEDVLRRLRKSPKCGHIPVVILTSSDAPSDRERATRLGISEYFRKPSSLNEFMQVGGLIHRIWTESRVE